MKVKTILREHTLYFKLITLIVFSIEPGDIVGPIIFLLSDYAAMITGISMPIDGGLGTCYA